MSYWLLPQKLVRITHWSWNFLLVGPVTWLLQWFRPLLQTVHRPGVATDSASVVVNTTDAQQPAGHALDCAPSADPHSGQEHNQDVLLVGSGLIADMGMHSNTSMADSKDTEQNQAEVLSTITVPDLALSVPNTVQAGTGSASQVRTNSEPERPDHNLDENGSEIAGQQVSVDSCGWFSFDSAAVDTGRPSTAAGSRRPACDPAKKTSTERFVLGPDEDQIPSAMEMGRCRPSTASGSRADRAAQAAQEQFLTDVSEASAQSPFGNVRPSTASGSRRRACETTEESIANSKAAKRGGLARGFFNTRTKKPAKRHAKLEPVKAQTSDNHLLNCHGASGDTQEVMQLQTSPWLASERQVDASDPIAAAQSEGVCAFHLGSYDMAKLAFDRMLETAVSAENRRAEGQALLLLGNTLDKLSSPDEQVDDKYKRALEIAYKTNDMELSFNVLLGMGAQAQKKHDWEVAEHYYLQSQTLAQRVLTPADQAKAESNLALCLAQSGSRRNESYAHFRKAAHLFSSSPGADSHDIITNHANYASALSSDGKRAEAKDEYLRALSRAKEQGNLHLVRQFLAHLSGLCEGELCDPEQANVFSKELASLESIHG